MRQVARVAAAILLTFGFLSSSQAQATESPYDRSDARDSQLLLRVPSGQLEQIQAQYGLTVVADSEIGNLVLVEAPEGMTSEQMVVLLEGDPAVETVEMAALAALPKVNDEETPSISTTDVLGDLLQAGTGTTPCWDSATDLWKGFVEQEANWITQLDAAHQLGAGCGEGITIAILDTGVDPNHPLLEGSLVRGHDFVHDSEGIPSEFDLIPDQSLTTIVEQSLTTIVERDNSALLSGQGQALLLHNGVAPFLAPENVATLEGLLLPPYFGHGTMVAGLARWVAPAASIMPLRVFDGQGKAHVFDIVRAIYWAVDHGADVINMSFTFSDSSRELREAIHYAQQQGVVCVGAAGNQGQRSQVFPAAYISAVGVASTTSEDQLSDFSNFGAELVTLAAPGSGVISAYPGGHYAAGWGTSFSAPLVAGTLALIFDQAAPNGNGPSKFWKRVRALKQGSLHLPGLGGTIGSGRLDIHQTVLEAIDD